MAAQVISVSFSAITDKIICQSHDLEVCQDCQVDWTQHNELASSFKGLKELPPPNKPIASVNGQVTQLKVEGNGAYKVNSYNKAIELYTAAVELSWSRVLWEPLAFQFVKEELAPILSNRSSAYYNMGRYGEALVDAEIVIRLKKDWSKGYYRKGKALFELKRFAEAITCYRSGLLYEEDSQDLLEALKEAENADH
ncbi:uncharacterized protein EV154DRAFT_501686 [Mucor mucedo]|uniref:uncharacterized protein n=1 Tax=Mucor mucedo TaxID=29922 RepID=UPI002220BD9B|nr:uncharacterized protein EV154DRAFT_501686 [Mucor mucedo]KAI7893334.1 hypothetical protein EV154DRAFT_501686 [Mucor mucedo]